MSILFKIGYPDNILPNEAFQQHCSQTYKKANKAKINTCITNTDSQHNVFFMGESKE